MFTPEEIADLDQLAPLDQQPTEDWLLENYAIWKLRHALAPGAAGVAEEDLAQLERVLAKTVMGALPKLTALRLIAVARGASA